MLEVDSYKANRFQRENVRCYKSSNSAPFLIYNFLSTASIPLHSLFTMLGLPQIQILALAAFASVGQAAPHQKECGGSSHSWNDKNCMQPQKGYGAATGRAIYLLTNDAENAVVAVPIEADGKLTKGTLTKTGGAGSNIIDAATGMKAGPDALDSQSALTIVGEVRLALIRFKTEQLTRSRVYLR